MLPTARAATLLALTVSCAGAPPQSAPSPAATPAGAPAPPDAAAVTLGDGSALPGIFSRHHVFLRATVGGTPALLLFDSGASATILSPRLVRRLGLTYRGRHLAFGIGEPVADASAYDGTEIRIGALVVRPATVLSWANAGLPTYAGMVPDGVIGYDLLRAYVVVVDAVAGRVVAFDTSAPPPARRGARVAPLRVTNGLPVVDVEVFAGAHATLGGPVSASLPVVIDFGAGAGLQISREASERLGVPARLREARMRQLIGIGGMIDLAEGITDSVRIADLTIPNALVAADTTQTSSIALAGAEGFVGTEVLRRFAITLDYARGRAIFDPNSLLRAPFCRNAAGVCVRADAGLRGVEVVFVDPGSSASRAGIRPGALILTVDGAAVGQLSLPEIDRLLDRTPGPTLEVIRSASQLRALTRSDRPMGRGRARRTGEREGVSETVKLPAP